MAIICAAQLVTADNSPLPETQIDLTPEERTWITAHPEIRISGETGWPPFEFYGQNGDWQGIGVDYLHLALERIGLKATMTLDKPWVEKLEMLRTGELDMAGSMGRSTEREAFLNFTRSYFQNPVVIVTHRSDDPVSTMEDLKESTVAVEEGYLMEDLIRKQFPQIQILQKKDTFTALDAVATELADAYIGNRAAAAITMEQEQLVNLKIAATTTVFPAIKHHFGIRKDWPELVALMEKALASISDEEHRTIQRRWLGINPERQKKPIQLTRKERVWLLGHSEIRLGMDPAWPPIEFVGENGEYTGIAAEYVKMISQILGIRMTPVAGSSWKQVLAGAEAKEVDVLSAVTRTPERNQYLNFTQPYMEFPHVVFVQGNTPIISGIEALVGKRFAMENGYASTDRLKQDYPGLDITLVASSKEALTLLSLGKVDAYVGDLVVGGYIINQEGLTNVKVGAPVPYSFGLHFGVRKDWPEMQSILQKALNALSETDKLAARQKWMAVRYGDVTVDYTLLWRVLASAAVIFLLGLLWLLQIRRQKMQLQASEAQLQKILDMIPISIVVTARDGEILFANPHVTTEMEGANESATGLNIAQFYADSGERQAVLSEMLSKREVRNRRVRFRTVKGSIIEGLLSVIPIRIEGKFAQLGMLVNLTDRFRMEQALADAKELADESSKFKSRFLANMSHEIRTPMNAIIGMSYLALQTELTPRQRDYLSKIDSSAHNLLGIINDILDFSKIEAGKLNIESTPFFLDEVLENLADMVYIDANEKGLKLLFKRNSTVPNGLIGDPLRLGQILLNLVQNAIKFTEQGEIAVSIELINLHGKHASIKFSVIDTGIGIETDRLHKLFDAFVQADGSIARHHGGSGLGLSICKQLVELMHGEINAHSTPGNGSNFSFILDFELQPDLALAEQKSGKTRQMQQPPAQRLKGKVLLVEDNSINQQIAKELLERTGLLVVIAATGEEAVQKVQETDFDLVFMDIQMPGMDGFEATKIIRSDTKFSSLPIIAMTAHAMQGDRAHCIAAGMNDYISKPIDPRQLLQHLQQWLGGKTAQNEPPIIPPADHDLELPENLTSIDLAWGVERVGGNRLLYARLLNDFYHRYHNICHILNKLLVEKAVNEARKLTHTLQGIAGSLGAKDLQESARNMEHAIRQQDNEHFSLLKTQLCTDADTVFTELSVLVSDWKQQELIAHPVMEAETSAISPEERTAIMNTVADLLRASDPCAVDHLVNLQRIANAAPEAADTLHSLIRQIHDYDFEEALITLELLEEKLKG